VKPGGLMPGDAGDNTRINERPQTVPGLAVDPDDAWMLQIVEGEKTTH
jgi:hypothetical protein